MLDPRIVRQTPRRVCGPDCYDGDLAVEKSEGKGVGSFGGSHRPGMWAATPDLSTITSNDVLGVIWPALPASAK
jgi:hypothetical protein